MSYTLLMHNVESRGPYGCFLVHVRRWTRVEEKLKSLKKRSYVRTMERFLELNLDLFKLVYVRMKL